MITMFSQNNNLAYQGMFIKYILHRHFTAMKYNKIKDIHVSYFQINIWLIRKSKKEWYIKYNETFQNLAYYNKTEQKKGILVYFHPLLCPSTTTDRVVHKPKKESIKTQLCFTSRFNVRNLLLNWTIIAY